MSDTKRLFVISGKEYPDPDAALTVEDVKSHYAAFFPELATATAKEEVRPDGVTVVTFARQVGTKGALAPVVPATYLPGRHVSADLSDYNPGDEGTRRCLKCLATQDFRVGPYGGLHLGLWKREGKPAPRCPKAAKGGRS